MEEVVNTGDAAWMLMAASLVLLMTPGLAFFYGGMSRAKSVLNMMMMSFGAMAVIGVVYVLWGWSMSYGSQDIAGIFANPFQHFGLQGAIYDESGEFLPGLGNYPQIIDIGFQVTFAIITTALISGALSERVKFGTWMAFAAIWVTCAYFPLAHMVWGGGLLSGSEDGLAAKLFGTSDDGEGGLVATVSPIDFAGGTVVHINAGVAALVLALVVGKRAGFGRTAFRPHNLPFVMLGAALLWFGWFGFNAGSAFAADGTAGLAWVNTTTATAAAILGWLLTERLRDGKATSLGAASGAVAGLVAITPAAGCAEPGRFDRPRCHRRCALRPGRRPEVQVRLRRLARRRRRPPRLRPVGHRRHRVPGYTETGLFYGGDYKQLVVQIVIALVALVFTGVVTS